MHIPLLTCLLTLSLLPLSAAEYHVAPDGDDTADGSTSNPLRSIDAAAQLARPGDTVWVHEGIYREHVKPARGGSSETERIVYRALPGHHPTIRGSDEIDTWTDLGDGRWQVQLDADRFGDWNPYVERMKKGTLPDNSRQRSLGEVFVDGTRFDEVNTPADVDIAGEWSPDSDGLRLVIHPGGKDPNAALTEIAVREQCFAPEIWNLGYITVSGFIIEHAANDYDDFFSKSTSSPQHGALSTTAGHHWLIEENLLRLNKSIGLDFGIQGAAEFEVHGIPEVRGHHLIRNNRFVRNGTTGAIGYKVPFCTIRDNAFIDNNTMRAGGHGKAGLKMISYCVDTHIEGNYFADNKGSGYAALWLDWGSQGSRATRNVFINNSRVWIEAQHGPIMFDRNIVISSPIWITDGTGVLLAHNLFHNSSFTHRILVTPLRDPPYMAPHSTEKLDDAVGHAAHLRVSNKLFSKNGLDLPDDSSTAYDNLCDWNVFAAGATPDPDRDDNSLSTNATLIDQLQYDEQGFSIRLF
ncbi:MAG: right-handed parallel beta-helix repeat-containing protein, partial [Planctomycetota bacterium]